MVSCGAITSRKLARISYGAELVYWRVYMASDNRGTMSGDVWDVWHQALPGKIDTSEESVTEHLDELVRVGLLERWTEPSGSVWIHVTGHDKHQSAQYIARRGKRRTPIPPSQIEDHEDSGEAEITSSDAEVHASPESSTVLTSTSTTTTTKEELASSLEPFHIFDAPPPSEIVAAAAEVKRRFEMVDESDLLEKLRVHFRNMSWAQNPELYLEAALSLKDGQIRYPGAAFSVMSSRLRSLHNRQPVSAPQVDHIVHGLPDDVLAALSEGAA